MKILLAADGSVYTGHTLNYLATHTEWLGGTHAYTVLHVVPAVPVGAASLVARDTLTTYYDEEAAKALQPVRAFFERQGLQGNFVFKVGHAAELIAEMADSGQFDLVMLGSHGHGALHSLVMGSVSAKVLAHCKAPLLLVR
jgi:nucleotide-binding universal stress UspA family protein